jgi:hypothetical protein
MPESSDVGLEGWLVDAHVHVHPSFERRVQLDAAAANFRRAAERLGRPGGMPGVLMLTESAGVNAFDEMSAAVGTSAVPGWSLASTAEAESLRLGRGEDVLYLVAGRQVITTERLEVLALGTRDTIPDGLPLAETVRRAVGAGALPVVPWGFGKWSGTRGRLLADYLQTEDARAVLLGDNGGRPAIGRLPVLLAEAERSGRPIVPGTDPLPIASQVRRAGSFGFVLAGPADSARPCDAVLGYLRSLRGQPRRFGRLMPAHAFVIAQLRMQWQARARRYGGGLQP